MSYKVGKYWPRSTSRCRTRCAVSRQSILPPVASMPTFGIHAPLVGFRVHLVALTVGHQEHVLAPIHTGGERPHDVGRIVNVEVRMQHDAPHDLVVDLKPLRTRFDRIGHRKYIWIEFETRGRVPTLRGLTRAWMLMSTWEEFRSKSNGFRANSARVHNCLRGDIFIDYTDVIEKSCG
jgi:hypothetical protein